MEGCEWYKLAKRAAQEMVDKISEELIAIEKDLQRRTRNN